MANLVKYHDNVIRTSPNVRRFMVELIPVHFPTYKADKLMQSRFDASPEYKRLCDEYWSRAGDLTRDDVHDMFGVEFIREMQSKRWVEIRRGKCPRIVIHWLDKHLNRCAKRALQSTDPAVVKMYGLKPLNKRKRKPKVAPMSHPSSTDVAPMSHRCRTDVAPMSHKSVRHTPNGGADCSPLNPNTNTNTNSRSNPSEKPSAKTTVPDHLVTSSNRHPKPTKTDDGFDTLISEVVDAFNVKHPERLREFLRTKTDTFTKPGTRITNRKNYLIKCAINEGWTPRTSSSPKSSQQ